MNATGDDRCPVAVFKKIQSKRPARYCEPNHPFCLGIVTHKYLPSEDEQWFLSAPVGKNKIANLMQNTAKNANMPGLQSKRITNSSVRKHLCQKIIANEVPDTHAIHITGHKNTESLNNYRTIANKQKRNMSAILSSRENQNVPLPFQNQPPVIPSVNQNTTLKLYCRYLHTRPCMINHIWGLKQLWLQVNGHAWFHLQRLRWPVRNGEGAKNSKWKYMSPAGFEPTPGQSTTGKLQRLRPLGHEGLMVISG